MASKTAADWHKKHMKKVRERRKEKMKTDPKYRKKVENIGKAFDSYYKQIKKKQSSKKKK